MSENNVNGIIGASLTTTGIIGATVAIGQYIINDYVITIAEAEGDYGYIMTITRGSDIQTVTLYGLSTEQYNSMLGYLQQAQEAAQNAAGSASDAYAYLELALDAANRANTQAARAEQASDTARSYASQAQTAKQGAETAKTDAQTARTQAQGYWQAAETAATRAGSAATRAETALAAAETAQSAAEAAQTAAEAAETDTQTYAGQASQSAANAAQSAANAAQTLTQVQAEGAAQIAAIDAEGQRVIDSIPEDYSQMEEDVTDLKSQIADVEDEIHGKCYFNVSDFSRGNIAYGSGAVITGTTYRVITPSIQHNSGDVIIKSVADGFDCYVGYYSDAAGTSVSGAFASREAGYTIPKNTYYRMLIRRETENTSEVADVTAFVHTVELVSYIEKTFLSKTDAAANYAKKLDVSNLTDEVSNLTDAMEITFPVFVWEQGTIRTTDGSNISTDLWIRTSGYFSYQSGNTLHVKCDSAHRGNVYEYTYDADNGTYVFKGAAPFTNAQPYVKSILGDCYYRLAMTRVNDTKTPVSESVSVNAYVTEGAFNYATNVIFPEYEVLDAPSAMLSAGWSDFCIINGKLWLFKASADEDHTDTNGKIFVYNMADWTLEKTISHNFGHMNTCSYDAAHDILLVGNLPGNSTYACALYVFYDVTSWLDETSLSFATVDKSIINLRSGGWTSLGNVSATFGENNGAYRNIVYVSLDYGAHLAKLILGMGTNQLSYGYYSAASADHFNGTFNVLKECDTDYEIGKNTEWTSQALDEVWQGCDYYKGKILSCNGDKRVATASLWNFKFDDTVNREIIRFDIYQDNGEPYRDDTVTQSLFPEGIAYDPSSDSIYMGLIYTQSGTRAMHLIRYKV